VTETTINQVDKNIYQLVARFSIEEAIVRILQDHRDGMNVSMIAEILGFNKGWIGSKYMDKLVESGQVRCRNVGSNRIFTIAGE
jgi:hypothetical protein